MLCGADRNVGLASMYRITRRPTAAGSSGEIDRKVIPATRSMAVRSASAPMT